jgi:hypothetical protein
MRKIEIVSVTVAAVLSGCYTQSPRPKPARVSVVRAIGRRLSYQESQLVRVPDRIHVYKVGRLPSADDESMHEAGNYYHTEQSAYWNRFAPGSRVVPTATGPGDAVGARVYRGVPDDQQLTELRNETRAEKEKALTELGQLRIAREKLDGMTQGIAHTDEVIRDAREEISRLKNENDELKRKAAMKDTNKPVDTDFSKFGEAGEVRKQDDLQPGPVQ